MHRSVYDVTLRLGAGLYGGFDELERFDSDVAKKGHTAFGISVLFSRSGL
jgi:hypothetical protein